MRQHEHCLLGKGDPMALAPGHMRSAKHLLRASTSTALKSFLEAKLRESILP